MDDMGAMAPERDPLAVRSGELSERRRIRESLAWVLIDMQKLVRGKRNPHAAVDLNNLFRLIRERCFDEIEEIERSEAADD